MNKIQQLPFSLCVIYTKPYEIKDEDGRAIGESRAPEECWLDKPLEWKKCPYHGSRNGKRMNNSALERLTYNLKDTFKELAHIRAWYFKAYDKKEINLNDLWNIAFFTINYPFFQYFKSEGDSNIREGEADLFKMLLGIRPVLDNLNNTFTLQNNKLVKVTAEQIIQDGELNKSFIGRNGVCAGPPKMMSKTFDILLNEDSGIAENCYFSKFGESFTEFTSSIKAAYFLQKIYALNQLKEVIDSEKKIFGHCWFFNKKKRFIHTYLKFLKIALPPQILLNPKGFSTDTTYRKRLEEAYFDIIMKDPTMPASVIDALKQFQKEVSDSSQLFNSNKKNTSEINNSGDMELFIQRIKLRDEKYKETILIIEEAIAKSLNIENETTKEHIDRWRYSLDFPSLKQMLDIIASDNISKKVLKLRLMIMHNIFFK